MQYYITTISHMKENKKNATNTFYCTAASVYYLRGSEKIIKKRGGRKNEGNIEGKGL